MAPLADSLLTCTPLASCEMRWGASMPRTPLRRRLQEELLCSRAASRTSQVFREQFLLERTTDRQLWLFGPGCRTDFSLKMNVVSLLLQGKQLINSICCQW